MQSEIIKKIFEETEKHLENTGEKKGIKDFFSSTAKKSCLAFIAAWLFWNLLFSGLLDGLVFAGIISTAVFVAIFGEPKRTSVKNAKKIEKNLPFALMQLSIDLNTGTSFEDAIKRIAESDYGVFSEQLKTSITKAKATGKPIKSALLDFVQRNESGALKRAVAQLLSVYEHGGKKQGEIIRRIALEQLSRQKTEAKAFSEKLVVFSLAFIVLSAIIPSLFQAFIIVGSSFIEISFSGQEALLIITVGFPLIEIAFLLYLKSITPEVLKG